MTKPSTRNAKDTLIKLVIIVRIVATHKVLQFEPQDVNPVFTLWPFLASRDRFSQEKNPRAASSIAGLSA